MSRLLIDVGWVALSARFLKQRTLRSLLTGMGVALGVALLVAFTVLGGATRDDIMAGDMAKYGTHHLTVHAPDGRSLTSGERSAIERMPHVLWAADALILPAPGGHPLDYVGVGPVPKREFLYGLERGRSPGPAEFVTTQEVATQLDLEIDQSITLPFTNGPQSVTLTGIRTAGGHLHTEGAASLLFDLHWLQNSMNTPDQTTLLMLKLDMGPWRYADRVIHEIGEIDAHLVVTRLTETAWLHNRFGLFDVWAPILGGVGVAVALLLVVGSMTTAVQERLQDLALLRALGASDRHVMGLVLREAMLLGGAGSLVGTGLGLLMAWLAHDWVAAQQNLTAQPLSPRWGILLAEAFGGFGLAVLAAWRPAKAAQHIPPLQAMRPTPIAVESQRPEGAGSLLLMGVGGLIIVYGVFIHSSSQGLGSLGAVGGLLFVLGLLLALPWLMPLLIQLLTKPARIFFPAAGMIAERAAFQYRSRNALTAGILVLGMSTVLGMGTFMDSLIVTDRNTTEQDYFADGVIIMSDFNLLPPDLAGDIAAIPGVTDVFVANRYHFGGFVDFDYTKVDPKWMQQKIREPSQVGIDAWKIAFWSEANLPQLASMYDLGPVEGNIHEHGVILTAQFAQNRGIQLGQTLSFAESDEVKASPDPREVIYRLPVVAIVQQLPGIYHRDEFLVSPSLLRNVAPNRIHLNWAREQQEAVLAEVAEALSSNPGTQLLQRSVDAAEGAMVFTQMWALIKAVGVLTLVVTALGMSSSVLAGIELRRRELALIRAVGSGPGQLTWQIVLEMIHVGLASSLLGILGGLGLFGGIVAIKGDSLMVAFPSTAYWICLLAGPLIAAATSLWPGLSVARGSVSHALHTDA